MALPFWEATNQRNPFSNKMHRCIHSYPTFVLTMLKFWTFGNSFKKHAQLPQKESCFLMVPQMRFISVVFNETVHKLQRKFERTNHCSSLQPNSAFSWQSELQTKNALNLEGEHRGHSNNTSYHMRRISYAIWAMPTIVISRWFQLVQHIEL